MLSVIVITKDEEERIRACLESVKWAGELVIADNGSSDNTLKIARQYTRKIVEFSGADFSTLRNKALEQASGDWVLCVDADERVLQNLREEIERLMLDKPLEVAWAIPRRNIVLGEEKKYPAFWPDYVIRLFRKNHLKGWTGKIHEQPVFDGELGKLKSPFLHLTHRDIDSMVLKSLSWAEIDVKLRLAANHPPMTGWRFLRILMTEVWNQGIVRRGFFNGTVGVIDSLLQVFSLYLTYVKLWQMQRSESLKETYKRIDRELLEKKFQSYKTG